MNERKLIVLDLDETLIFSTEEKLDREPDFLADQYFVYERPFVRQFLGYCFENFEVGVWTTATSGYATHILGQIAGDLNTFSFVWTRDRCSWVFDEESNERIQVKKLEKLRRKRYRPESIIVVDDTSSAWKFSYGNLVPVRRFEGDQNDDELEVLIGFLDSIKGAANIRAIEKRNWRSRTRQ